MMPRMRQALVEFENVEDAVSCVQMCQVSTLLDVVTIYVNVTPLMLEQSDLYHGQTSVL